MEIVINSNRELRKFGFLVGTIFLIYGLIPILKNHEIRIWATFLAFFLIVSALLLPRILAWPYQFWMKMGGLLGWFNTRLILTFAFFIFVTPMGLLLRILGKNSIVRGFQKSLVTYRVEKKPRPADHLERMF